MLCAISFFLKRTMIHLLFVFLRNRFAKRANFTCRIFWWLCSAKLLVKLNSAKNLHIFNWKFWIQKRRHKPSLMFCLLNRVAVYFFYAERTCKFTNGSDILRQTVARYHQKQPQVLTWFIRTNKVLKLPYLQPLLS